MSLLIPDDSWPWALSKPLTRLWYKVQSLSLDRCDTRKCSGARGGKCKEKRRLLDQSRSNETNTHNQEADSLHGRSCGHRSLWKWRRNQRPEEAGPQRERALLGPGRGRGCGSAGPRRLPRRTGGRGLGDARGLASFRAWRRSLVLGWGPEASEGPWGRRGSLNPAASHSSLKRQLLGGPWSNRCFCSESPSLLSPQPLTSPRSCWSALGPRSFIRLVPCGCGCRAWVWALRGKRRSSGAWAGCDGELLLDAVLRAAPQGSGEAATCRRRWRASPLGEGPDSYWLLLFVPLRGTPLHCLGCDCLE